jgi:glycosyltransferase involved in cell wall biosynthesis
MTKSPNKLRLLLLCASLAVGKGGAERVITELADEMSNRGHSVCLAYREQRFNKQPAYASKHQYSYFSYNHMQELKDHIISSDPDVFFSFYVNHLLIDYFSIVHKTGIPFGMQECTNPERLCCNNWHGGKVNPATARWEREMVASGATAIRLTMPNYKQSFPPYIQSRVHVFTNPTFSQTAQANFDNSPQSRKSIININGFKANKNLLTLLQSFALLAEDFPEWNIRVIGKEPDKKFPHVEKILDFISENNLKERVTISGPVDDIYAHFAAAHIHAIASLSEGCPTVVLEAMSMGLPSVGYADCPGTNDLIRHGENGLLASPEDRVGSLAQALEQLMSSAELRERMGRVAWEDSKQFDPKTIYDQWEQLFFEAAEYKNDPERLFREQMAIDPERAMHARRMREELIKQVKVE